MDFKGTQTLRVTFSNLHSVGFFQWMFWFFLKEVVRETDRKKIDRPHIEPVSRQSKLESGPFSTLLNCANEEAVRD